MTATATEPAAPGDVGSYLDAVAAHLASVPWLSEVDRLELLDDLTQHLSEVAAEDAAPLAERLGPPVAYADELLAAAGLDRPSAAPAGPTAEGIGAALTAGWGRLRSFVAEVGDLRPAWWILRGYLAASLLGALTGGGDHGGGHPGFPVPAVFGSSVLGLFTVVAAVRMSVHWGRHGRPARRWVAQGAVAVLGVYGAVLLAQLGDGSTDLRWVETGTPIGSSGCLVNGIGQPVENIYPYDADGRLIDQVLLYDQTGRPLDNVCPHDVVDDGRPEATESGRDVNGAPVTNVFPRRQSASPAPEKQGPFGVPTTTAAPATLAPPAVVIPRLATTTTSTTTTTTVPAPSSTPAASEPTTAVPFTPPPTGGG